MSKANADLDPEFWPTVATVIPVLALAIVVEARAIVAHWGERGDIKRAKAIRILQSILCVLWITPLILSIYLESTSFEALEDEKVSHTAVALVGPTVGFSLAVLVLAPAIELLIRTYARAFARLLLTFTRARAWWKWQRNVWSARKILRIARRNVAMTYDVSAEIYATETSLVSLTDPRYVAYVRREREKVNDQRLKNLQRRKEFKESVQRVRDLVNMALRYRAESKELVTDRDISNMEKAIMNFRL